MVMSNFISIIKMIIVSSTVFFLLPKKILTNVSTVLMCFSTKNRKSFILNIYFKVVLLLLKTLCFENELQ